MLLGLLGFSLAQAAPWSYFGGDSGAQRYAPHTQITAENAKHLEPAWIARTGEQEEFGKLYNLSSFQNTPALIGDSLIACSSFSRVIAYDPASGEEKWRYDPWESIEFFDHFTYRCRGLAYWQGEKDKHEIEGEAQETADLKDRCNERIFLATASNHVIALDPGNGQTCPDFGDNGIVFIDRTGEQAFPGEVYLNNPGTVVGDVVVFGSPILDSYRAGAPTGKIMAFDVYTGELRWEFDPIPRDDSAYARENWLDDSARSSGGANVWSTMTADEERDLLFVPTGSPSPDFYGALRPGDNRDANSLVALKGQTGEKVWSFQFVHHDLWDYDVASPPVLVDLQRSGSTVPAVVQNTKQGLIFVFNRETGEPLFDIEERPVPQSDVPGEWTSPTQPFPVKPEPLVEFSLGPGDAWGFTFWDEGKCREKISARGNSGIYTPPSLNGTVQRPAWMGGTNWGGPAINPRTGVMVVNFSNVITEVLLERRTGDLKPLPVITVDDTAAWRRHVGGEMLGTPYRLKLDFLRSPFGAPCNAPPWGELAAVDLNSGDILWKRTLGNLEELAPVPLPLELGTPNIGGPLVTESGVVFIAATMDNRIRAFHLETGEEVWSAKLPAGGQAGVMSYAWKGKQYVVIGAGGHAWMDTPRGDYYVAYALPEK